MYIKPFSTGLFNMIVVFNNMTLQKAYEEAFNSEPRAMLVRINNKEEVWPALQRFFSKHPEMQTA